jgi:integrase/recombinase XerD
MLAFLLATPRSNERIRQSWLREQIDDFLSSLAAQRFKESTLRGYAYQLLSFGEFVEQQGIRDLGQLSPWIEPFIRPFPSLRKRTDWGSLVRRFARFVAPGHLLPVEESAVAVHPQVQFVMEYATFLREHRGLGTESITTLQRPCLALLRFLADEGCASLNTLKPEVIHRFLGVRGKRCSRRSMRSYCSALRGFLAYLYRRGVLPVDLSPAVLSPRVYKHEQCPRFLTRAEIEAVLSVIDRQTPAGKRSYAMLVLLAVYGLRGIEVRSLRLDDIDWRNERIRIANRKAGNTTIYPLAASVGDALLAYLQDGRPVSSHREVFLRTKAPNTPLTSTDPLAYQVRKYLTLAGIKIAHPGTHSFRYSCAQRLFETGMPLKTIGDYLGHTHPDSTQRYTKIAIDQLREVALGDGEDVL